MRRLLSLWLSGACSMLVLMGERPARAEGPSVDACIAASDEGQVFRDQSKYLRARDAFRICGQTACPGVVQRTCVRWLAEIEEAMPTVVLAARAADDRAEVEDVSVELDGAPLVARLTGTATPVDPGRHVFAFKHAGTTVTVETLINASEKNRLLVARFASAPLTPRPPPPPPAAGGELRDEPRRGSSPVLPLALGAIGAAAFVTAGIVGGGAVGDLHALERDPCASTGTCSGGEVHSVRTRLVVADVAVVAGILAVAGAGLVWWLSR